MSRHFRSKSCHSIQTIVTSVITDVAAKTRLTVFIFRSVSVGTGILESRRALQGDRLKC